MGTSVNLNDVDWELLSRYLGGLATPEEQQWVDRWLVESPEHWAFLQALREMGASGDAPAPPEWKAAVAASLRRREDALALSDRVQWPRLGVVRGGGRAGPRFTVPASPRMHIVARALLALFVAAGAVVSGRLLLRAPAAPPPPDRIVTTQRAQQILLRLADGTAIKLAPASTLRIPATYGTTDRTVRLEGEAAFTVVHDSTQPFAVHTERAVARDLGTRFVVRAYPGDRVTDVVVAEGEVAVAQPGAAGDRRVIRRGARARVTDDGNLEVTPRVALEPYFAWTEGRLVFRGTPLRDVAAQLGRWYDIDVRLTADRIADRTVTASLKDEPAPEVLALIAATLHLTLARDGRTYTLSPQ